MSGQDGEGGQGGSVQRIEVIVKKQKSLGRPVGSVRGGQEVYKELAIVNYAKKMSGRGWSGREGGSGWKFTKN